MSGVRARSGDLLDRIDFTGIVAGVVSLVALLRPNEREIAERGIPVYRTEGGEIVGYLSNDGSVGFVPK